MDCPVITASDWGAEALTLLSGDPTRMFDTVPLDRLLGPQAAPRAAWSAELAQQLFRELALATLANSRDFMARLAVPLADSKTVDLLPVNPDQLQGALNEYSPPSLYLCRREMFLRPDPFEQYLKPLGRQELATSGGVVFIVYSCGRDPVSAEKGWDYSRIVWFNFYPAELAI
jgi:hypothetical protein